MQRTEKQPIPSRLPRTSHLHRPRRGRDRKHCRADHHPAHPRRLATDRQRKHALEVAVHRNRIQAGKCGIAMKEGQPGHAMEEREG